MIGTVLLVGGVFAILLLGARTINSQRRLATSEQARYDAEALGRSEQAVREHLAHIGTALDNMAQGLCMLDANGYLVVANQQLAGILGLPHLPPVGSRYEALLRDHSARSTALATRDTQPDRAHPPHPRPVPANACHSAAEQRSQRSAASTADGDGRIARHAE